MRVQNISRGTFDVAFSAATNYNAISIRAGQSCDSSSGAVYVGDVDCIAVMGEMACWCHARATTLFHFAVKVNNMWNDQDTNHFSTLTVSQCSSATVRDAAIIDVEGVEDIRLDKISNTSAVNTCSSGKVSSVRCHWQKQFKRNTVDR
ncbi:MAG: hypothetical protein ACW972_07080 [Promethearchaeota archaeon]|jgi:hypothetical protein